MRRLAIDRNRNRSYKQKFQIVVPDLSDVFLCQGQNDGENVAISGFITISPLFFQLFLRFCDKYI